MKLQELMEMAIQDVSIASSLIRRVFKSVPNLEVQFGSIGNGAHMTDRVTGREQEVTLPEIVTTFQKVFKHVGMDLFKDVTEEQDIEWVVKNPEISLNLVFAVKYRPRVNKYIIKCMTMMRKDCDKFHSKNQHSNYVREIVV